MQREKQLFLAWKVEVHRALGEPGLVGVTVRLLNVEWEQALDVILKVNNFAYEMDGNVIRVAPAAKLAAERDANHRRSLDNLRRLRRARDARRSAAFSAQRRRTRSGGG